MKNTPSKSFKFRQLVLATAITLCIFAIPFTTLSQETGSVETSNPSSSGKIDQEYIRLLEKRVSDLEALVEKLLEDKEAAAADSDKEAMPAAEVTKDKKEEPKPPEATDEEDEWGEEPEVEKAAAGRDEDARRRITDLETWRRKEDAKAAKKEEEESKKTKFALSGKYKLHYNIRDNLNLNNPTQEWEFDSDNYFDQRFMLALEATHDPFAVVFVLDKGNFVFDWKEDSEGTLERWNQLFTAQPEFVRELYLQYTGPFRLKAGRQNIPDPSGGMVLEGPGDGLILTSPTWSTSYGRLSGSLAYLAVAGGYENYDSFITSGGPPAGDRSAVFGADNRLDGFYLTLNYKPTKELEIDPYLVWANDRGRFGDADLNLDKDFDVDTLPRDGNFEPLYLASSFKYHSGKFSSKGDFLWLGGSHDNARDINAYAAVLGFDYKLSESFSLGIEAARGSGDKIDESETDDVNTFYGLWICKDRRKFANIFSEDLRAGYFFWDSSLANVTLIKARLGYSPFDKLNLGLSGLGFWTSEKVFKGRGPIPHTYDWSSGRSTTTETTRDLGWEINFDMSYQLFKRLAVYSEFGYFIPGDVYQQADGNSADPATELVIGTELKF